MQYKLYSYDLWGNSKEGYQVNDLFYECELNIPENIVNDDKNLVKYLKKEGILAKGLHFKSIEILGESDFTLYFEDVRVKSGGLKPIFELRRVN